MCGSLAEAPTQAIEFPKWLHGCVSRVCVCVCVCAHASLDSRDEQKPKQFGFRDVQMANHLCRLANN